MHHIPDPLWRLFFDQDAIVFVQTFFGYGHALPFRLMALIGDTWGVMLTLGVAFWLWGRRAAYAAFAALLTGAAAKQLLTFGVGLPRPSGPDIVVYEDLGMPSFPSGHVFLTLVPWATLSALRRAPWTVTLGLFVLVGLSRLYLGTHYLGDVLAALPLGLLFVAVFIWAWHRLEDWLAERPFSFYLWTGGVAALLGVGSIVLAPENPRRWEVAGLAVGAVAGFLLEYRYLGYRPRDLGFGRKAAMVLVGAAGIAVLTALDRLALGGVYQLGMLLAALAMLWVTLGAPLLFVRLGWADAGRAA